MGIVTSALVPPCFIGTGVCLLHSKTKFLLACLVPLACEAAHIITGEALQSEGNLIVDDAVNDAAHWTVVQFGIRSYSLNCCGRWNHLIDTFRRLMAPCSSSFSGRMIHDVVVATIHDTNTNTKAYMIMSKAHNGDLKLCFCHDLDEVDIRGKPVIFGIPRGGWWKALTISGRLQVQDLIDKCFTIPTEYQPVSNNCHHFSKELWNWHATKLSEEGRGARLIRLPRGRCRSRESSAMRLTARRVAAEE